MERVSACCTRGHASEHSGCQTPRGPSPAACADQGARGFARTLTLGACERKRCLRSQHTEGFVRTLATSSRTRPRGSWRSLWTASGARAASCPHPLTSACQTTAACAPVVLASARKTEDAARPCRPWRLARAEFRNHWRLLDRACPRGRRRYQLILPPYGTSQPRPCRPWLLLPNQLPLGTSQEDFLVEVLLFLARLDSKRASSCRMALTRPRALAGPGSCSLAIHQEAKGTVRHHSCRSSRRPRS